MDMRFCAPRPEPAAEFDKHWDFALIRPKLALASGSSKASDLREFSSPRHNQLHSGSCVPQSAIKALEIKRIKKYGRAAHVDLSRLALYYLSRELMLPPETHMDAGTYGSVAAEVLRLFGVCKEEPAGIGDRAFWPFEIGEEGNPESGLLYKAPSWAAMRQAYLHKISAWYKIGATGSDRVDAIIDALAAGNPVIYCAEIFENFAYYNGTPISGYPGRLFGGHGTVLVGWEPQNTFFWGENSWGTSWGPDGGFYKITPEYIASKHAFDFIVMTGGWEDYLTQ